MMAAVHVNQLNIPGSIKTEKLVEVDSDSKEVEEGFDDDYEDPISYAEKHNFTELAELLKKHFKKS